MKSFMLAIILLAVGCDKISLEKFDGKGDVPYISEVILSMPTTPRTNPSSYWHLPVNKDVRMCNPTSVDLIMILHCPGLQEDNVVTLPAHTLRHALVTTNVELAYEQSCVLLKK